MIMKTRGQMQCMALNIAFDFGCLYPLFFTSNRGILFIVTAHAITLQKYPRQDEMGCASSLSSYLPVNTWPSSSAELPAITAK